MKKLSFCLIVGLSLNAFAGSTGNYVCTVQTNDSSGSSINLSKPLSGTQFAAMQTKAAQSPDGKAETLEVGDYSGSHYAVDVFAGYVELVVSHNGSEVRSGAKDLSATYRVKYSDTAGKPADTSFTCMLVVLE